MLNPYICEEKSTKTLNMLNVNKILVLSLLFWHLKLLMNELYKLHPQFGWIFFEN
jgi:hypothetical protein